MKTIDKLSNIAFYGILLNIFLTIASMISNEVDGVAAKFFLSIQLIVTGLLIWLIWKTEKELVTDYKNGAFTHITRRIYIVFAITIAIIIFSLLPFTVDLLVGLIKNFFPNRPLYFDNFLLLILLGWNLSSIWNFWKYDDLINKEIKNSKRLT